jgi:hypothetical protein
MPGDCAAGLGCRPLAGGAGSACQQPGQEGVPCSQWTGDTQECGAGLFCDHESLTSAFCRKQGGAGASCGDYRSCGAYLECVDQRCVPIGDLGAACSDGSIVCPVDQRCDESGRCVKLPGVGETCLAGSDPQRMCDLDLFCGADGRCVARPGLGAACVPAAAGGPEPCGTGHCDATTQTCTLQCTQP